MTCASFGVCRRVARRNWLARMGFPDSNRENSRHFTFADGMRTVARNDSRNNCGGETVMFELHGQLAKDCAVVGDLALSRVLLMNDTAYPWLILVPRRAAIAEIFQ